MTSGPRQLIVRIMREAKEIVWVQVPLDVETARRLRHVSDMCHADEKSVAASLLHDILKDDEDAHGGADVSPSLHYH